MEEILTDIEKVKANCKHAIDLLKQLESIEKELEKVGIKIQVEFSDENFFKRNK